MSLKTISTMPESERRAAMVKLAKLIKDGYSITEISTELNIPESEIRKVVEWVKNHKEIPYA